MKALDKTQGITKALGLAAAATVMAGMLSACGGGESATSADTYCDSMESAKETFTAFESGDAAGLEAALDKFHELAAEAPDEVANAWATLDGTMVALEEGLAEAGLEISDLEAISAGELPEGVDMEKLATLGEDLQQMGAAEVQEAADAIETHAKEECDIDLSAS